MEIKLEKRRTPNERFHASGGVCPQKHLCGFGSLSPARTFVNPPPAWSRHHVSGNSGGQSGGQLGWQSVRQKI